MGALVLLAAAVIAFVLVQQPAEPEETEGALDSSEAEVIPLPEPVVDEGEGETPEEVADEEVADEEVADEEVADEEVADEEVADEDPEAQEGGEDEELGASIPPDSPLAGELPPLLAETMEKIAAGYQFEQPEFRELFGFIRNHRDDVRGHLVLARAYMSRGWYTAAFERYEVALRNYEEARTEQVLRDLLEIIREGDDMLFAVWPNIRRFWGRDALPIVDEAIAAADRRARSDLERLRARIDRLP